MNFEEWETSERVNNSRRLCPYSGHLETQVGLVGLVGLQRRSLYNCHLDTSRGVAEWNPPKPHNPRVRLRLFDRDRRPHGDPLPASSPGEGQSALDAVLVLRDEIAELAGVHLPTLLGDSQDRFA